MNRFFTKILSYSLAIALLLPSGALAYDATFQTGMKNGVFNSYDLPVPEKVAPVEKPQEKTLWQKNWEKTQKLWQKQLFLDPIVSLRKRLEVAFENLPSLQPASEFPVIDLELLDKLEIVRGGTNGSQNLVTMLTSAHDGKNSEKFIYTTAGTKAFVEFISMPIADGALLKQRQAVIKELVANDTLRSTIVDHFKRMQLTELYLYDIYQKDGLSVEEQAMYPGTVLKVFGLSEVPSAITFFNNVYYAYPVFMYSLNLFPLLINKGQKAAFKKLGLDRDPGIALMLKGTDIYYKTITPVLLALKLTDVLGRYGELKSNLAIIANLQKKLINVAQYVRSCQAIVKELAKDKIIRSTMPEFDKELKAYALNRAGSKRFQKLVELLNTKTFDGPEPSYLSSPGNILIAYKLISEKETRADFARLFDFVGRIEAFVAMAQKMKAHEKSPVKFCFVDFDTQGSKPYIDAKDLWNPFVPADKAIGNDLSLNMGNERDILLTGPNTSGKSTFIKSVMISLVMAQSFGVAPAQSMRMTPFAKLLSYMSITDNVAAGISQFRAETIRANELKQVVQRLKANEFAFFILDEIFTGTAPEQAEKLSYDFIRNLTNFSNVLFINATHFKKLSVLETDMKGLIKNYHLGAEIDAAGQVTRYTRKLVPGVAQYSSAEQVAREAGITQQWDEYKSGSW